MISQLLAEKVGLQRLFSQPEQAKLRGVVSRAGIAVALVSCRLQHHSSDRGELR